MAALAVAFTISGLMSGVSCQVYGQEDPSKVKPLAEGVLKVIPVELNPRDSFSTPMALPGLEVEGYELNFSAQKDSLLNSTRQVVFYRDVWQYEFAFTGLRQKSLTLRYSDGTLQQKNIWYLVWRVRDFNNVLSYTEETDEFGHTQKVLERDSVRLPVLSGEDSRQPGPASRKKLDKKFLPSFSLEGYVKESIASDYRPVRYRDINSPTLARYIQSFEDPNLKLHTKLEMSQIEIPLAESETDPGVWGVAIWEDVDPRIDYASVYVNGMTNAYRIQNNDGEIGFKYKTLQLNFWRPGDRVGQDRDDVDYGIPLVDQPAEQVEICRFYNLPNPLLRGYEINPQDNRNVLKAELDGQVELETFTSPLVTELDSGKIPSIVLKEFAKAGINLDGNVALNMKNGPNGQVPAGIRGERWTFSSGGKDYFLLYEPQFWRKRGDGIQFIKSLDHFWIYR